MILFVYLMLIWYFVSVSEKCWIGFTGGVLADVLEDDRTFAMLYLVIANKGPEIVYNVSKIVRLLYFTKSKLIF